MYPVMLDVSNQRCLVVGGGGVALRKVEGLLADGALVTVVADEPISALTDLASTQKIVLEKRPYQKKEASNYWLVFAATDDREVNKQVYKDAREKNIWVNVADDPELCDFHLPARIQRGPFQLAIGSAGEAPFVVRRLRQLLERRFGQEWSEWIDAAARFRCSVRNLNLPRAEQEKRFDLFFQNTVDAKKISARVPTAKEENLWLSGSDEKTECANIAIAHDLPLTKSAKVVGFVSLVGAGPGDAGLLTIRGRQRLLAADVVVYDRLAETVLPCELDSRVELHCVGKTAGHHPVPQEEINALLIRLAREGKRVVRLKGGDPFVFGRGGEEAEALCEAKIPFEVVPCVTAGLAVPAYAGIPVTHRAESVRLTLVTAHESAKDKGPQVRWDLLAQDPHVTLVGYMGVTSLSNVAKKLIAGGMDPNTPAAMIERGTTSGQKVVKSTISDLPDAVSRKGLRPPGLFVIGKPVGRAEKLDWFGNRPLLGERIGIVGPAYEIGETLELSGVEVVEVTLPITKAARIVMAALPLTGWIFRSPDEVDVLDDERDGPSWGQNVIAWCMNDATAKHARSLGWPNVKEIDKETIDIALIEAIKQK